MTLVRFEPDRVASAGLGCPGKWWRQSTEAPLAILAMGAGDSSRAIALSRPFDDDALAAVQAYPRVARIIRMILQVRTLTGNAFIRTSYIVIGSWQTAIIVKIWLNINTLT